MFCCDFKKFSIIFLIGLGCIIVLGLIFLNTNTTFKEFIENSKYGSDRGQSSKGTTFIINIFYIISHLDGKQLLNTTQLQSF